MVIPNWLNFLLQEKDLQTIEAKVASIERQCNVEIVPVIVRQSSEYPQTNLTLNLSISIFTLFAYFLFSLNQTMHWDEGLSYSTQLVLTTLTFFILLLSGRQLAKSSWIKRTLNCSEAQSEQCFKRAEIEFYKERIQETQKQNGILIFISLLEHKVIILSDKKVQEHFSDNALWDNAVKLIIESIPKRRLSDGLYKALDLIENELKTKMPLEGQKHNLLSNKLIIKD